MSQEQYDALKLENQICFPLYAAAREVIKRYRPYLDALDLTYTQYIAMMVLWETGEVSVKELGKKLFLDSGTLTPVLKSLEGKGYLTRRRSADDERMVLATLTREGLALRDRALSVPAQMAGCVHLQQEDASELYRLLYTLLDVLQEQKNE
ncbi:MAG: MarR family transcriptional regulator [Ruminococcaceae bacterium]|jgi:DNA-binding MarR family transcriptional regulator|nr:MarR family transcriptional regulator [Oscillospiraceae bacterium]